MPQVSDDLYENLRGVPNLGKSFSRAISSHRDMMDPLFGADPPEYVKNLMGNFTIRSMLLRHGDATNSVNMTERPFHIARVYNEIHLDLMRMLGNIELNTKQPAEEIAKIFADTDVQAIIKANKEAAAMRLRGGDPEGDPVSSAILQGHVEAFGESCTPDKLPMLSFTLTNPKDGTTVPIEVPNRMVDLEANNNITKTLLNDSIPLATIAWGLGEASKGKLLSHDAVAFITAMVGVQDGLTLSIEALLNAIKEKLPDGTALNDFVRKDGVKLTKVIREEAHHMQIMRAMEYTQGSISKMNGTDALLLAAGVDPLGATLNTNDCARDTACMLYALGNGLTRYLPEQAPAAAATKLTALADAVSHCSNKDAVVDMLRQADNKQLLEDIGKDLQTLQQQARLEVSGHPLADLLNYPLMLIGRDLLPELKRTEVTPKVPNIRDILETYKAEVPERYF